MKQKADIDLSLEAPVFYACRPLESKLGVLLEKHKSAIER